MGNPIRVIRGSVLFLGLAAVILGSAVCTSTRTDCSSPNSGDHNVPVNLRTPSPLNLYVSKSGGYTHQGAQITFYSSDGSTLDVKLPDNTVDPNPYPTPSPSAYSWVSGNLDTSLPDCAGASFTITLKGKDGQTNTIKGRIIINK